MATLGFILSFIYVCTPPVVAAVVVRKVAREKSIRPSASFLITCCSALVIGTAMATIFAFAVGGRIRAGQVLVTAYLAISALCLLKGLSWLLERGSLRLLGVTKRPDQLPLPRLYRTRVTSAFLLRALVLYAVGLPYVMAVAIVYRPKATPKGNPY